MDYTRERLEQMTEEELAEIVHDFQSEKGEKRKDCGANACGPRLNKKVLDIIRWTYNI